MKLVLFGHPAFLPSQSMPRFATMLELAFKARGHAVQVWRPQPHVYNWLPAGRWAKWAGYLDQFVLFPLWVRRQLRVQARETLFVFADQALGPWVPLVQHLPHVVHAHDLLALRSAQGEVPENPTSWTGRIYQRYIRRGFQQARHFISVSKKTRDDLHRYGGVQPHTAAVVYNGLNYPYAPLPALQALQVLLRAGLPAQPRGMLLHVSGGQWYKNVVGVVHLYSQYAEEHADPLPLWMIGPDPNNMKAALGKVPVQGKVLFFKDIDNVALQAAYSLARALLFPSLEEGFGWPIIEAQACGCPVVTTDAPPMNEVGGPAALYLPRLRHTEDVQAWTLLGAHVLGELLAQSETARAGLATQAVAWAQRFDADEAINSYLRIYEQVLAFDLGRRDTVGENDVRSD